MQNITFLLASAFAGISLSVCAASIDEAELATARQNKVYWKASMLVADKNDGRAAKTYEEVRNIVMAACDAEHPAEKKASAGYQGVKEDILAAYVVCNIGNSNPAIVRACYNYAKANNVRMYHFIGCNTETLGISVEDSYTDAVTFAKKCGTAGEAKRCVQVISRTFTSVKEDTVKADLKTLNRMYSVKMVENKEAWAPIVQMIRTMLATF